jgi:predicted ATPase
MRQALDCARQQGALSWELRAATSAARLLRGQDRRGDAVTILGQSTNALLKGSTRLT